ncbi:MAG: AMP-binding protein [Spongiibacteraceae bacterium]
MCNAPQLKAASLWQLLEQRVASNPSSIFLIDPITDRLVSFGDFKLRVEQHAAWLLQQGIGSTSVVVWQWPTEIEAVILMFALSRLGVVQAPVIHLYREREISEIVQQVQPTHFLVMDEVDTTERLQRVQSVVSALPEIQRPEIIPISQLPLVDGAVLPDYQPAANQVRWYFFTSGTTARPKGARHSDQSLMAGGIFLAQALDVTGKDVGTVGYPIAHIGGIVYCAMALNTGIPVVLLVRYTADLVVASYRRYDVSLAGGSTAHYQLLLEEQRKQPDEPLLPALRLLSGGGAAKPAALFAQVKDELGVKIVHAYGMTEAPISCSNTPYDSDEQLTHSDGIVMPNLEIKIIDSQGKEVSRGERGEIILRGPNLCQGYLIEEQTVAAFDSDGFYHTGDLGLIREDGHIAITGRLKEIIIRKGENISAREIEELLAKHSAVKDVAVIGLPDDERGEMVCAVVELVDGSVGITMEQMQIFLADQQLMRQKIPERLEIMHRLPRNESLQKVQKNILYEMFA